MTGRKRGTPKVRSVAYELFAEALGRSVDSPEVQTVVALLGGTYDVRPITRGAAGYDPDVERTVAWDFPDAPRAYRWAATHLGVRDGIVVWLTIAAELVGGVAGDRAASFTLPDDDREVYRPRGAEWNWAPGIVRRGEGYLLSLDVPHGHWDGNYKFPITERQATALQEDLRLYREVWDGLVRICQSRRFLDDPTTLPGDAQAFIDARCGRD